MRAVPWPGEKCLWELWRNSPPLPCEGSLRRKMPCPACRTVHAISGIDALPKNYVLVSMLER